MKRAMARRYTPEEKQEKYELVLKDREEGKGTLQACADHNFPFSTYNQMRKAGNLEPYGSRGKQKRAASIDIPIADKKSTDFKLQGSPREVAQFLHELSKQFSGSAS